MIPLYTPNPGNLLLPSSPRALVIEGGGMKGSFAGGVLSAMSAILPSSYFDIVVGVSSGSCSAAFYVTEDHKDRDRAERIVRIWREELDGKKLINPFSVFKGKRFLDQEYLIDYLFGEKYGLKRDVLDKKWSTPFHIVVTNIKTHQPEYIRATGNNILGLLKAATALPIATRGKWKIGAQDYTDGAISDPLPIEAVLLAGYKDITVVMNNPLDMVSSQYSKLISWLSFPFHKGLSKKLHLEIHHRYDRARELLRNPPPGVHIKLIAPTQKILGLVSTEQNLLNRNVDHGIELAKLAYSKLDETSKKTKLWIEEAFEEIVQKLQNINVFHNGGFK